MPKVHTLVEAEAARAAAQERLGPEFGRILKLQAQLDELCEYVEGQMLPYNTAVSDALEEQSRTLTAWVQNGKQWENTAHRSYKRYRLRMSGPYDKCWDSVAWLRMMVQGERGPRKWTLDIKRPTAFTQQHVFNLPLDCKPEDIMAVADLKLMEAGFFISPYEPESFKD